MPGEGVSSEAEQAPDEESRHGHPLSYRSLDLRGTRVANRRLRCLVDGPTSRTR
jgi:hypothetical protein